jgi:hypothetical protein
MLRNSVVIAMPCGTADRPGHSEGGSERLDYAVER